MNTPVTIITTGRVTADLELKTSQNGKNTKYVQFGLAVNKGYGEKEHPNFYNCLLYGEDAQRIIDAKVKKGSLIQIVGDLELVEYNRKDGSPDGWQRSLCCRGTMHLLTARRRKLLTLPGQILKVLPPKTVSCLRRTAARMDFRLTDTAKGQTVKRGIA